ncbi:hypothetical protein AAFN60_19095 [Roseibacillus persicicus]|uniref:hypothetical protein n=1 Tax=Roseibacillus persicicus TaxID=454148 RepID=UPI00398A7130
MSELDKIEYDKLTELASKLEAVLNHTGTNQTGVTALLTTALGRIENLQQEGVLDSEKDEKRKNKSAQEVAIAAIVARETRLSQDEKVLYTEFLEKKAFEKKDFKKLEQFYTHSYEKLSDDGKAQMSQRIDEGIRRGHFDREDLPDIVRTMRRENQKTVTQIGTSESESEQQPLFGLENSLGSSLTDAERSSTSVAPSENTPDKETSSSQDAELLAQSLAGISFAATDLPKAAESSTQRTT